MSGRSRRRGFGYVRKLPSGRWQASYVGPDLVRLLKGLDKSGTPRRRTGPPDMTLGGCLRVQVDHQEAWLERLEAVTLRHLEDAGYQVLQSATEDRCRTHLVAVPEKDGVVRLSVDGEIFSLSFPGGHSWVEFAYEDEDRQEALQDLLRFLDAYASPDTREVTVPRRLLPDRKELRVSNGAVLHARGWSSGPPS